MDVLDLVVPEPGRVTELVRSPAPGDGEELWTFAGTPFARAWNVDELDVDYRLPSVATDLAGCTVLRVERALTDAVAAAHHEARREPFDLGAAVRAVLSAQPYWYVWCEREVDADALAKRAMDADECAAEVLARVRGEDESFDFVAWPQGRAHFVQTRLDWSGRRRR